MRTIDTPEAYPIFGADDLADIVHSDFKLVDASDGLSESGLDCLILKFGNPYGCQFELVICEDGCLYRTPVFSFGG